MKFLVSLLFVFLTGCTTSCRVNVKVDSLESTAKDLSTFIARKDGSGIAKFIHPERGVRFTPYSYVSTDDIIFQANEFVNFFKNTSIYSWGVYDGSGEEILLTPADYFSKFIYPIDFRNHGRMNLDKTEGAGNSLENYKDFYPKSKVVEWYYPGTSEYGGMDWRSLRLVFEEKDGKYYLVCFLSNQWTS